MYTQDTAYAYRIRTTERVFLSFYLPNGVVREQLLQETGLSWAKVHVGIGQAAEVRSGMVLTPIWLDVEVYEKCTGYSWK